MLLAIITMRKSIHEFPLLSYIDMELRYKYAAGGLLASLLVILLQILSSLAVRRCIQNFGRLFLFSEVSAKRT